MVETVINLQNGRVSWRVNGSEEACMTSEYLKTEAVRVVPYMEMTDGEYLIEWCGCS